MMNSAHIPRAYIFVNGILAFPGDSEGWTDRAVTWTHVHFAGFGEKFEYLAGALTRRFKQQERAEKLARMIGYYERAQIPVVMVGHSNGCDIILRTLQLIQTRVEAIHLISAACEADFEISGLNKLLENGRVGHLVYYLAGSDRALWFANVTRKVLQPFGLGYGVLGHNGPENISATVQMRTKMIYRKKFHHSTWFEKPNFDSTMELVTSL
jgi:pimeloyl-ACP methyl ester carboxylesterase